MTCYKVPKGWKIILESGKTFPKIYKTKGQCQIRQDQLDRHDPKNKPK